MTLPHKTKSKIDAQLKKIREQRKKQRMEKLMGKTVEFEEIHDILDVLDAAKGGERLKKDADAAGATIKPDRTHLSRAGWPGAGKVSVRMEKRIPLKEYEYRVLKKRLARQLHKTADKSRTIGWRQGMRFPYFQLVEMEFPTAKGTKAKKYYLTIKR